MTITQESIVQKLSDVPVERLNEIDTFIQFVIYQSNNKANVTEPTSTRRKFGCGKDIVLFVADDFNEPMDDFKEYM